MDGGFNLSSLRITPEILTVIAEIDEFKGAWLAIGRIAPERLARLRRVATIESIGASGRIEGARLSDREVGRLLASGDVTAQATRDEQVAAGCAQALEAVLTRASSIDLTEDHIKQLHRDLLRYADRDVAVRGQRGQYKTRPNTLEAFGPDGERLGIVFATATPFGTPRLMQELVTWTRQSLQDGAFHPLLVIAVFVVAFLDIHPFQDGNGRLSRILTTLLLLRAGYAYVPYSALDSEFEQTREAYYRALRQTQITLRTAKPDWQPWVSYFLDALRRQRQRLERKIEHERTVLGDLPALSAQIMETAREQGRVTVAEVVKVTGSSRNTVKDHVKALAQKGHLTRHGAGRGTWYSLA